MSSVSSIIQGAICCSSCLQRKPANDAHVHAYLHAIRQNDQEVPGIHIPTYSVMLAYARTNMLHAATLSKFCSQQQRLQHAIVITTVSGNAMNAANKRCMTSVCCSRTLKGLKCVLKENITPAVLLLTTFTYTDMCVQTACYLYVPIYTCTQV